VHRGHLAVINEVIRRARVSDTAAIVVTFDRHPASVVRPESAPLLLTDTEQKLELLATTGIDATIVVPFGESDARESAEDFARRVFVEALRVRDIVVGEDFHFGHRRAGNVALLRSLGMQHDFVVEPLVLVTHAADGNAPTSSTAIRAALKRGDVRTAALMLGRDHELRGVVVRGDQRGRTIGFPTANLACDGCLLPADGVYAATAHLDDGRAFIAAVSVGIKPTFTGARRTVEAHLIGFDGAIGDYGWSMRLELRRWVRDQVRFTKVDDLIRQIGADTARCREELHA